jgi:hypothetical protein
MTDIPTKCYWMGEDIDTLPVERLREIVRHLGRELESSRERTMQVLDMSRAFAAARARF